MFEPNALTDTIAMTIAVSFALQPAIGPGVAGMVGLLPLGASVRSAPWAAISLGMLFGALLGGIAWVGDRDPRWIAIGALAGLLAGAGEARARTGWARNRTNNDPACRCEHRSHRWE